MEDKEDTLPAHKCELGDTQEADYKTLKMLLNLNVQCTFQISLAPSSHCVSLTDLETCYSAPSFLTDLTSFLDSHLPTATWPNPFDTYDVSHYINILQSSVLYFDNSKQICKIHTSPAK